MGGPEVDSGATGGSSIWSGSSVAGSRVTKPATASRRQECYEVAGRAICLCATVSGLISARNRSDIVLRRDR